MELPACPENRACHTEEIPGAARRPDPGLLPGVFVSKGMIADFAIHDKGTESPRSHPADHAGNGRKREMASQEPESV